MENIKNSLDFCAAGLHYKSAANRKDLAELLLQTASENTISPSSLSSFPPMHKAMRNYR